jgi:WD40 repeat protein
VSQLRGDLDWIVMKCLEKDRTRRYETANGLAMDIKRHLSNEPVAARPPSKLYEFQKTFRRHKVGFIATGSVMLALAVGVALATWQAMLATQAKGQEAIQRQKAQANEQRALEASAKEAGLRGQAEVQELAARQRAYASEMNSAALALQGNNRGRAVDLLNRQRPAQGQKDLRGWEWRYVWQQVRSDTLFTLCRQSSEINSLSVSPNASLLAVGTRHRGGVSVWDLGARRELVRLAEGESYSRIAFSPTEPLLALSSFPSASSSAQSIDRLRLWKAATRQIVADFPLEGSCLGLAFAMDGRTLAASTISRSGGGMSGTGGSITLYRIPEGTRLSSFPSKPSGADPGVPFACTADLSVAAYPSRDGRIRVVDLRKGEELWTAVAAKEFVTTLAFSPDGSTLASGAGFTESDIRLWKVATGEPIGKLAGHSSWVSSIVFWPDGKRLASSSADQSLRIWDIASQTCLDVLRGHRQEVWRLALLPDSKTLISGSKDGVVCFWDTSFPHPHQTHMILPERVATWGMTPDSQSIVTLNQEGQVSEWKSPDFKQNNPLLSTGGALIEGQDAVFSEDARSLAVGSTNGTLQVWDLEHRTLKRQWTESTGVVRPEAFLAASSKLVTTSMDTGMHHEWDLGSTLPIQSWPYPLGFSALSLSPDDRYCLAFGYGGDYALRTLTEQTDRRLPLDGVEPTVGSFSSDGSLFVIASDMGFARVWNTSTWREVATVRGVLMGMNSARFSPDGKRLVVASSGAEAAKLFDTESWQEVFTLAGSGTGSMGAKFSPDGNSVLWGNTTGDLYIWHAPSWDEIKAAEARERE